MRLEIALSLHSSSGVMRGDLVEGDFVELSETNNLSAPFDITVVTEPPGPSM
jgi:hypothetical protein